MTETAHRGDDRTTTAQPSALHAARLAEQLAAGEAALSAGQYRDAATLLEPVATAMPGHVPVVRMAATAWQLAGQRSRARAVLAALDARDLEQLSPNDAHALGAQLLDVGAPGAALDCFALVARTLPNHPAVLGAMAGAHRALGNLDDAWRLAQRATAGDKHNAALWLTAAQVRHSQGQLEESLKLLKKAEALRPAHGPTRMQRALTRLLGGTTSHGWSDFEHRGLPPLPPSSRVWRGEPLAGSSIVVVFEQGIGDLFHFVRYAPLLTAQGASRVFVEAPDSAVSLLRASGLDAVPIGQAPVADFAVPVLSLPLLLGVDRETGGDQVPYLHAGDSPITRETAKGKKPRRRLGLVLRGNPNFLATNLRDIGNECVSALEGIPDIDWVWMQLGEDSPSTGFETPSLSHNWLETASLLASLDGLVTVDTGLAHLAGAMGSPTWVLLPHSPDWRWGLRSDRTPWYPTATLIRQPRPRDWDGAIDRLRTSLADVPD
jgi:tetratricopeptide (TPR) repeat protein